MLTPEYPGGREVIIIANDLTYQIGSFGPLEDQLFKVTALEYIVCFLAVAFEGNARGIEGEVRE